jgi:hypothetical protein
MYVCSVVRFSTPFAWVKTIIPNILISTTVYSKYEVFCILVRYEVKLFLCLAKHDAMKTCPVLTTHKTMKTQGGVEVLLHIVLTSALYEGESRDNSVGIALGYGLDDRGSRIRFPEGAGNFSLHHRVQNGSGDHPAFYPMGTRGFFPGGKVAGA